MSARTSAVASATKKIQMQAQEIDNRRRLQIANQVAQINRLMAGERTYDDEMRFLQEELADAQAKAIDAMLEVKRLKALYEPETTEKAAG